MPLRVQGVVSVTSSWVTSTSQNQKYNHICNRNISFLIYVDFFYNFFTFRDQSMGENLCMYYSYVRAFKSDIFTHQFKPVLQRLHVNSTVYLQAQQRIQGASSVFFAFNNVRGLRTTFISINIDIKSIFTQQLNINQVVCRLLDVHYTVSNCHTEHTAPKFVTK